MALIQCSECGKEISDQIAACPHCGYPVQKQTDENKGNNKKKLLLPIIIAGIILVLIAIIFICYKFVYKGSFEVSQSKDSIELGTGADLVKYIEFDPEKILEVKVADDGNFDADKLGDYTVVFSIKNKRGNMKDVSYDFHVVDTVAPELSVLNDTVYAARGSEYNPEDNAEAADADACTIEVSGEYDLNQEGTYEITFVAKDGSGNASEPKSMKLIVEDRDNCVFRNVKFGDSAEVVKRYETAELITEGDDNARHYIIYEGIVEGDDAFLYYDTNENDELYAITVIFNESHTDHDLYINSFNNISDKLTALYGEAKVEKAKGSLYGYCDSEGDALNLGQVKYRNSWDTDELSAILYLAKDNYEVSFALIYQSKTYEGPEDTGIN